MENRKKRGRPAQAPPWLKPAAQLVANGYMLRRALWRLRVSIPQEQRRRVQLLVFRNAVAGYCSISGTSGLLVQKKRAGSRTG
jgi:hypothetical protein